MQKNRPRFDTYSYLKAIHGVDVTAIYGIGGIAAGITLSGLCKKAPGAPLHRRVGIEKRRE